MIIEKIDRTIEFNIAYDILDAAIHRCLSNTVRGFVDFEREEPTRATTIYMLSQYQLGRFGRIRIDKLSNDRTSISLFENRDPFSPDQKLEISEAGESLGDRVVQAIIEGLDQDSSFRERKKRHYDNVMTYLLNRLDQESIWPEEQTDSQTAKRDISIGKNVTDSTIVQGNNNIINIDSKKTKKK
jgi:hypothetical protein